MESEDSSLCPAQPATGNYPEPDKSSHYHTSHFFMTNFNILNCTLLGYYTVRSVNLFSEYNRQDTSFLNSFISVTCSTCFRWFFPSIIRSSKLRIQCQVFVRPLLLLAASLARLAAGSSNGLINTWCCMYSFELLIMDGKNCLKHVEHLTEINELRKDASCWLYSENKLTLLTV